MQDGGRSALPLSVGDLVRWGALIAATIVITIPVFGMLRPFLVPLAMAAIVAGMSRGLFVRVNEAMGNRRNLASGLTLLILVVGAIIPLLFVGTLAAQQAAALTRGAVSAVRTVALDPEVFSVPPWVPYQDQLAELRPILAERLGAIAGASANYALSTLTAVGRGTAAFVLNLFIFLYALFFFLKMDVSVIQQVLDFTPLNDDTQARLAERVMSVSRATIKGTFLIGLIQGALGGLGFWVAGLESAVFWGVAMAVLSVIPGLGPGLILTGGALVLWFNGDTLAAIGLAIWMVVVVMSIDNLLRPTLVGRDAKLHDIMILVSTLGGLAFFGAVGLVLGPVLAGLFVTIWTTLAETVARQELHAEP